MTWPSLAQLVIFLGALVAITKPLGAYMASVFTGKRTFLSRALAPVERAIYRTCGIDPAIEQTWTSYAAATLAVRVRQFCPFLCPAAFTGHSAFESEPVRNRASAGRQCSYHSRPRLQYRRQFHDQRELAILPGRDDPQLFRSDGGNRRTEFRFGAAGLAVGGCADSRLHW